MSQPVVSRETWVLDNVLALLTLGSFAYLYWLATHYPEAWGAFLLIAGHLAALFYFVMIWRPRRRLT